MAQPGRLENEGGPNISGPLALAGGAVYDRSAFLAVEKNSSGVIAINQAVISDEATAIDNVVTSGAADSVARKGIAQNAAILNGPVWVAVLGKVTALSVAAGVVISTRVANGAVAGQTKAAAANGASTNLGRSLSAAGAVANTPYALDMDPN